MRDKRFIAEHRGGPLKKEQHRQLMLWACDCAEHVLHLFSGTPEVRLEQALSVGRKWTRGEATTGQAMKASLAAHAAAREASDPTSTAVARAVGQAVATAHMADHSLGGALYALKAVNSADKSIEAERAWQKERLPPDVAELALSGMSEKQRHFRI